MTSARALSAGVGFFFAWFATSVVPTPLLWYLPLAHRVQLVTTPTTLGMDLYGRLGLSLIVAVLAAFTLHRVRRETLAAWLLSTFVLTTALEVVMLSTRHPVALDPAVVKAASK